MSVQELKDGIAEAVAQGNLAIVEELSRKLRAHIKIKLEERALDIAGMPKGAAGDDIEDLRELARETGNLDALYILDAKAEEIGWAQIHRTLAPIRRIEQREKRLEDYLARGNNLERVEEEKKHLQDFFTMLAKNQSLVVYGYEKVKKALEYGAVSKLLISEAEEDSIIDELEGMAEQTSTEVIIVSVDTEEGRQLRDLAKVGAILRFPLQ
jgi:ribosomal protein L7Ae-like RNA K-turn-binding protein